MKWFFGAGLLLLIALAFNLGLLAYAMYVLLAVMLTSRLLARTWVESLEARRECNRVTANIGDTVAVVIVVDNRGSLPIPWVLLEDLLPKTALIPPPPRLRVLGRRLKLIMLGGRSRKTISYQMECSQRGYFQIGPLMMETGDVFGLHRRYRVVTNPHFLMVYPEVLAIEGYDVASRRPIGEIRMTHRLYEDPTRIAGVRDYQPGDPLNRIHWTATARTGQLHSKFYEPSSIAGATLLLDFHRSAYPARGRSVRSELAVTATASLANTLYEMNQQVGLVTNGRDAADRIRQEGWEYDIRSRKAARRAAEMRTESNRLEPVVVPTRRGSEQFMRILKTLARVELTDGLSFAELVTETAGRIPRDATVLALLGSADPAAAIALGTLRRSGFAVTAILNTYELHDFEITAGRLLAEGIEVRQLKDKASIGNLCRSYVLR